jgi:uncharacterized protein
MNTQTAQSDAALDYQVTLFVLKVASRCNLNCSYCYVYNQGDETWRDQPHKMSPEVVTAVLQRARAHCLRRGRKIFSFIFHGGEPLLLDQQFYIDFVRQAHDILMPDVRPLFGMQSNGTLLTTEWCELLNRLDIGFGISLDGPPEVNDRARVDHAGRGSYEAVRRGIEIARAFPWRHNWGERWGILNVIDPTSDPIRCYEHMEELQVERADFLFPDNTYDNPPVRPPGGATAYADWLIAIFDRWFHQHPKRMQIRMFESIIGMVLGRPGLLENMGSQRSNALVIETDGGMEPTPGLKVCGNGFTKLGLNILTHDLESANQAELARTFYLRGETLCATCERCQIKRMCGGGHLPNRYSSVNGFDNPSVYCEDLIKLITHVQRQVHEALPAALRGRLELPVADPLEVAARARGPRPRPRSLPVLAAEAR